MLLETESNSEIFNLMKEINTLMHKYMKLTNNENKKCVFTSYKDDSKIEIIN